MTDIVNRLRNSWPNEWTFLVRQAADEIERLRSANEWLKSEVERLENELKDLRGGSR